MQHTFNPDLLARLQKHAKPFVDSIEDVIHRAVDALESLSPVENGKEFEPAAYTSDRFPDFTWAKPLVINVNGESIKPEWNVLMIKMVETAAKQGIDSKTIKGLLFVPAHIGTFDGPGYKFIGSANISIQGQNANKAWEQSARIAKHINAVIEIEWLWYHNPKAQKPGGHGKLTFPRS